MFYSDQNSAKSRLTYVLVKGVAANSKHSFSSFYHNSRLTSTFKGFMSRLDLKNIFLFECDLLNCISPTERMCFSRCSIWNAKLQMLAEKTKQKKNWFLFHLANLAYLANCAK